MRTVKYLSFRLQIPKSNWRQKHQDFIQAIRYAKQATTYEKSGEFY